MELWIRSQNKGDLLKVEALGQTNGIIKGYFLTGNCILGKYETGERALEVLDEIQRILIPKGIIKVDGLLHQKDIKTLRKHFDNNYTVVNKNVELLQPFETLVYEMPKE